MNNVFCSLGNFWFNASKNGIEAEIISLFSETNQRVVFNSKGSSIPESLHVFHRKNITLTEFQFFYYEERASVIKDKLDLMGYTYDTAKLAFTEWHESSKKIWAQQMSTIESLPLRKTFEVLFALSVDNWIDTLKIINSGNPQTQYESSSSEITSSLECMLSQSWYGFPGLDRRIPLRLMLEEVNLDDYFIYDVTELFLQGGIHPKAALIENGRRWSTGKFISEQNPTKIYTEGVTDAKFIKQALALLYPHLKDYFSFIDFRGGKLGKVAGSVGQLVNNLKTIEAVKAGKDIIALFDNDAAAHEGTSKLLGKISSKGNSLPHNIRILFLPELDYLKNYPTIGPSEKLSLEDINGKAATIEFYFGEDVLKTDGENLTPVRWTSYMPNLEIYQGEIIKYKGQVQKNIEEKLHQAELNGKSDFDSSWNDIQLVFKMFFSAFNERNRELICNLVTQYPNDGQWMRFDRLNDY